MDTIRILFVISNQLGLDMLQIDVNSAFLNGTLDEEIFMNQPECSKKDNRVCKLKRSLYASKQASLQWNKCFTKFLQEFSLKQLKSDSCVFVNKNSAVLAITATRISQKFYPC